MGTNVPGTSASGLQPSKLPGAVQFAYTDVIDLVGGTIGPYVIIPPIAARIVRVTAGWEIKTTTGASVSPTYSIGSNSASFNNLAASGTTAALASQAAETIVGPTFINPAPAVDLTTSGLQINLTGAATATALTARFFIGYYLIPV